MILGKDLLLDSEHINALDILVFGHGEINGITLISFI